MTTGISNARETQFRRLEEENLELRRVLSAYESDKSLLEGPFVDAADHALKGTYGRVLLVHPTWSQDCGRSTLVVIAAERIGRVVVILDNTKKVVGEKCYVVSRPVGGGDVRWYWRVER